jgi:predicted naringenin-chalcone synthase
MQTTISQGQQMIDDVFINSVGTAAPPLAQTQEQALDFLVRNYGDRLDERARRVMRSAMSHPSVTRRYIAAENLDQLVNEHQDARIARFTEWAVRLAAAAAEQALAAAGVTPGDVTAIVVNTCSGYICPGLSTYLIERMGLRRDVGAYDLVGSGCGGAIPNLQMARALAMCGAGRVGRHAHPTMALHDPGDPLSLPSPSRGEAKNGRDGREEGGVVLSIAVEICSATFQMGNDLGLVISNALFGDGAAAAVVSGRGRGLRLMNYASCFAPELREDIRYVYRNGQLHNQLSPSLAQKARKPVGEAVHGVLAASGCDRADIAHWAIHPGGEKVINAVRDELGIDERHTRASRAILAEYGNISSPTVLFILQRIMREGIAPGERVMMVAFGAGLGAHCLMARQADGA